MGLGRAGLSFGQAEATVGGLFGKKSLKSYEAVQLIFCAGLFPTSG